MPEKIITVPQGIEAKQDGKVLVITGPKGELSREFSSPLINFKVSGDKITFLCDSERKRSRAILGTYFSHTTNMITGVTYGYDAKVKAVYSHFPVKMAVEEDKVVISNFLGGRSARKSQIVGECKVIIKKDDISITGISKEDVSQTAANIELVTKVTGYDRRIFQDGCYITQKAKLIDEKATSEGGKKSGN